MNSVQRFHSAGWAVVAAGALTLASGASALTVTTPPSYGSFGTLAGATFGGSGIPNDAVAMTTVDDVTLGLTATARYSNNPAVTNNGAGVFTATAGPDVANGQPSYGMWNFNFYIGGPAANSLTKNYALFYDADPTAGTNLSSPFVILGAAVAGLAGGTVQNSWNLGMGFLGVPGFDPSAAGEYTFALVAYDLAGNQLGLTSMAVNVVPEPEAYVLALAGMGLVGMFGLRRKAR